jgi:hypothetical protein
MADVPAWHAKGEWFDVCRCNVPCPCSWAQPPDDDYCDGVLVWHIREGRYGDVSLDGLNIVAFASFRGNVWEGAHSEPKMGVVIDARASHQKPPSGCPGHRLRQPARVPFRTQEGSASEVACLRSLGLTGPWPLHARDPE